MNAPFIPVQEPGTYRLKVADYLTLAEAGAFGDRRTEFIDGEVIVPSPRLVPHLAAKMELYDALRGMRCARWDHPCGQPPKAAS